jgi:hypothetical protein
MRKRKRTEPHTFAQRLGEQKKRLEIELARVRVGAQRDAILARIEQLERAADMHEFLSLRSQVARPVIGARAHGGAVMPVRDAQLPSHPPCSDRN